MNLFTQEALVYGVALTSHADRLWRRGSTSDESQALQTASFHLALRSPHAAPFLPGAVSAATLALQLVAPACCDRLGEAGRLCDHASTVSSDSSIARLLRDAASAPPARSQSMKAAAELAGATFEWWHGLHPQHRRRSPARESRGSLDRC